MAEKHTTNMLECCNAFVYILIQWKDFKYYWLHIDNVNVTINSLISCNTPSMASLENLNCGSKFMCRCSVGIYILVHT